MKQLLLSTIILFSIVSYSHSLALVDKLFGISTKKTEVSNSDLKAELGVIKENQISLNNKIDSVAQGQADVSAKVIAGVDKSINSQTQMRDNTVVNKNDTDMIKLLIATNFLTFIAFIVATGKSRKMIIDALKQDPRSFLENKDANT
jgi:hypothetical protein